MTIRSFDVFDTLLARRYINSNGIWKHMERESGIPGFADMRMGADTGSRNLTEIYQAMAQAGQIPADSVSMFLEREVQHEMRLAIPIQENLDRVRDGDLLISDMYMNPQDILKLVRAVGLTKQVTIYQSNSGKSSGAFWREYGSKLNLEYHIGDNKRSDVDNAISAGVQAIHYNAELTEIEKYLVSTPATSHLGLLVREIRLRHNLHTWANYLTPATQLNLPWLFFSCEILRRKLPGKKLGFLGRDCQLMERIYRAYFDTSCYYVPFSRQAVMNGPVKAGLYLNAMAPNCELIDISSSSRSWEKLAEVEEHDVTVLIYSDKFYYTATKPVPPSNFKWVVKNSEIGPTNEFIELFNCGDHGKVSEIDYETGLPLLKFAEPELSPLMVELLHKPTADAVALRQQGHYASLVSELATMNNDELIKIWTVFLRQICSLPPVLLKIDDYLAKDVKYTKGINS